MLFRITNNGKSPRGIHDERGSIVTIQSGETREVRLGEGAAQRYRAKIAGGDSLEMVEHLASRGAAQAPQEPKAKTVVPAPAAGSAPAPKEGKKRGRPAKPKAEAPAPAPAATEAAPAGDALADLRAEAVRLGVPKADADKWGPKRLNREIAALKQGK